MAIDPDSLRADARHNYDRLLQAAKTIFSSGQSFAPLDSVAKRAGVGIGTLYRHFPSREALLEAVYADKVADLAAKAQSLAAQNTPDKALAAWLRATIEYSKQYGGFNDLMSLAVKDKHSPIAAAGNSLLKKAQKTGLLRNDVTIFDLLQLVQAITVSDVTKDDIRRVDTLLSVVLSGLQAGKDKK